MAAQILLGLLRNKIASFFFASKGAFLSATKEKEMLLMGVLFLSFCFYVKKMFFFAENAIMSHKVQNC